MELLQGLVMYRFPHSPQINQTVHQHLKMTQHKRKIAAVKNPLKPQSRKLSTKKAAKNKRQQMVLIVDEQPAGQRFSYLFLHRHHYVSDMKKHGSAVIRPIFTTKYNSSVKTFILYLKEFFFL